MTHFQFRGIVDRDERPEPFFYRRLRESFYDLSVNGTGAEPGSDFWDESTGEESTRYSLGARPVQALRDLKKLKNDWDTYGAKAPTEENIKLAGEVCSRFPKELQPEISPEVDGTVGLYWDLDFIYNINIDSNRKREPAFSVETYDGVILVDEELIDGTPSLFEMANAFRSFFEDKQKK